MFEADLTRTVRGAVLDEDAHTRTRFAGASLQAARDCGCGVVIWHFASKEAVGHLGRGGALGSIGKALAKDGAATVDTIQIVLATRRRSAGARDFKAPLAAWWSNDDQLLTLDSTHRPSMLALISAPTRALIWLTAFGIDVGQAVGVDRGAWPADDDDVEPIIVSDHLQETVSRYSRPMTLSTNGIHDSLGGEFLAAVRPLLKADVATPQAVAVAALRAGWWPQKIPALLSKL